MIFIFKFFSFIKKWFSSTDLSNMGLFYRYLFIIIFFVNAMSFTMVYLPFLPKGGYLNGNVFFKYHLAHILIIDHGLIVMSFVLLSVVLGGFSNWFIPLFCGAPNMALPRLNNFSFWLLPPSLLLIVISSILLQETAFGESPNYAVNPELLYSLLSLYLANVSCFCTSINILITIYKFYKSRLLLYKILLFFLSMWFATLLLTIPITTIILTCLFLNIDIGVLFAAFTSFSNYFFTSDVIMLIFLNIDMFFLLHIGIFVLFCVLRLLCIIYSVHFPKFFKIVNIYLKFTFAITLIFFSYSLYITIIYCYITIQLCFTTILPISADNVYTVVEWQGIAAYLPVIYNAMNKVFHIKNLLFFVLPEILLTFYLTNMFGAFYIKKHENVYNKKFLYFFIWILLYNIVICCHIYTIVFYFPNIFAYLCMYLIQELPNLFIILFSNKFIFISTLWFCLQSHLPQLIFYFLIVLMFLAFPKK